MGSRGPQVNAYVANSAPFAQPILNTLRDVIHNTCTEVGEPIKWSFPHFMYRGVLCSMAAFKRH